VTEAWVPVFAGTTKGEFQKSPPDRELGKLDYNLDGRDPRPPWTSAFAGVARGGMGDGCIDDSYE
jgi:hypothetical protein